MKKVILIIIVGLLILGGVYYSLVGKTRTGNVATSTVKTQEIEKYVRPSAETIATSTFLADPQRKGWKIFSNSDLGISFSIPEYFFVSKDGSRDGFRDKTGKIYLLPDKRYDWYQVFFNESGSTSTVMYLQVNPGGIQWCVNKTYMMKEGFDGNLTIAEERSYIEYGNETDITDTRTGCVVGNFHHLEGVNGNSYSLHYFFNLTPESIVKSEALFKEILSSVKIAPVKK